MTTATLTPISKLTFGYKLGTVPDEVPAAWGARWIVNSDRSVDQVWDRQDTIGEDTARKALLQHLTDEVRDLPSKIVTSKLRSGEAAPDTEVVVLDDGTVRVLGRAAGGYFYITAYLLEAPA